MLIKKRLVVTVLAAFCLAAALFAVIPISLQDVGDYDPWLDVNDDGSIEMKDVSAVARAYGTSGAPVNKTKLALEVATAQAHGEAFSTTLETRSGFDWGWGDLAGMTVDVTVETNCMLLIMFSAEAQTTQDWLEIYVRALVDGAQANPAAGVTLTKLMDWASHSFTFYMPNVTPGTHTVKIQWAYNDEVGQVQVKTRTLIVTALLQ